MLTAKLVLERLDKEGRILERREKQARSFLIQFIELLYCAHAQIDHLAPYSMDDIGANPRDIDGESTSDARQQKSNLKVGSGGGESGVLCNPGTHSFTALRPEHAVIEAQNIGIQVGTGVGAVTPADTALGTRIAHGRGGGELEYGGCELMNLVISNPDGEFTIRRYFTNLSGGAITVEEVGLYCPGGQSLTTDVPHVFMFCIARDLTGGIAVADTEILRVTYVPQITV